MDNNVVDSICEGLATNSIAAFKLNFRGVGASEGVFSLDSELREDIHSAIEFSTGIENIDSNKIGLAGYSAGAAWGPAAAFSDPRVIALTLISPPLAMFDFSILADCQKPIFMICGDKDQYSPIDELRRFRNILAESVEYEIIENTDHFWWDHEAELSRRGVGFFLRTLSGKRAN